MAKLTHVDDSGRAAMVDVGSKRATRRVAVARGVVRFGREAFELLRANRLGKGDALAVARIAGLQAAKRTDEWIPLCHAIPLEHVEAQVTGRAAARWVTGVEMEALVAVGAACLALYDMAKSVERGIVIEQIRLEEKSGGRSGRWTRDAE
jgi:cyclic pyranopterin phosphate synthase